MSATKEQCETEKSKQWSFEMQIEANAFPNLRVAANEEDILCLTCANPKENEVIGCARTKKRNK